MKNLFLVMTANFEVSYVSTAPVADNGAEIVVRQDILKHLSVTQLVQIAKSMNPELKVNNKQAREIILAAIDEEIVKIPVKSTETKTVSSKSICYAAFDLIDMDNKEVARSTVEALITEHNIPKRVVQSYASNYRKAKRA
uniref:Uncharacterized protein n=1 Tax=Acinetobacter phage vB_AbaSt_W16 TaxID=3116434 RepID=A0AB38ZCV5_9CAUD